MVVCENHGGGIRGHFDGELTVRKQLVIRATGHVSGKIRYGKLSIDEGGELSGDIDVIGPVSPDNRSVPAAKAGTPRRAEDDSAAT